MEIITAYSVAFFNQTLKGEPTPLLANPVSAYPEVKIGPSGIELTTRQESRKNGTNRRLD
jgi:hypothetical protein